MSIFSSTQPSLRARVLPRFPAQVLAGTGITITRSGGVYTFAVAPYANIPLTALAPIPTGTVLGRDGVGAGAPSALTVSGGLGLTGAGGIELTANQRRRTIPYELYNNGSVLTTGIKTDIVVPFSCTIVQWTLLGTPSGSLVLDIWKDTYANFPPVIGDSITAGAKPTLTAAIKNQSNVLTGWTINIVEGDILRINIDSVATITRANLFLDVVTL